MIISSKDFIAIYKQGIICIALNLCCKFKMKQKSHFFIFKKVSCFCDHIFKRTCINIYKHGIILKLWLCAWTITCKMKQMFWFWDIDDFQPSLSYFLGNIFDLSTCSHLLWVDSASYISTNHHSPSHNQRHNALSSPSPS